jgi:hypothetical protein
VRCHGEKIRGEDARVQYASRVSGRKNLMPNPMMRRYIYGGCKLSVGFSRRRVLWQYDWDWG